MGFCAITDGPQRISPADIGHTQQVSGWIGTQFGTYIQMDPSGWILLTDPTLCVPLQRHQQVKMSMYPVKYLLNKYLFPTSFLRTKSWHKDTSTSQWWLHCSTLGTRDCVFSSSCHCNPYILSCFVCRRGFRRNWTFWATTEELDYADSVSVIQCQSDSANSEQFVLLVCVLIRFIWESMSAPYLFR